MMQSCRIHVMGPSGAGVTTLGRAVASELAFAHHDTDDFYWRPTVPPFTHKRAISDRVRLMQEMFADRADWVLTGSMDSWGKEIHDLFDWVIFLTAPSDVRCARLRDRETRHFGAQAVAPGGWRHRDTNEFVSWASFYEAGTKEGRSRARHEAWLETLSCPVLRLDGTQEISLLVRNILEEVRG